MDYSEFFELVANIWGFPRDLPAIDVYLHGMQLLYNEKMCTELFKFIEISFID